MPRSADEKPLTDRQLERIMIAGVANFARLPDKPSAQRSENGRQRRKRAAAWCLRQFDILRLAQVLFERGVDLHWYVNQLVDLVESSDTKDAVRLNALKELRRLHMVGASTHPEIRRQIPDRQRSEASLDEQEDDCARGEDLPDPFLTRIQNKETA
ncbi:MAG: hypothetical protein ACYSVY_15910 [Planctomycetota bacterium]|jgi:hypothetical protein